LTKKTPYKGLGADSEEKHEPVSDIDTVVVVDSLKALDPKRPIREADIAKLFDHLVGARKERWRYSEAKRLCGLKINRQLEPSWLNDRQFGRLLTF
jgi:hypothetical protein